MHSSPSGLRGPANVAIVIPAFNEASRIGVMLPTALAAPGVSRVFVVDDGSTDETADVARRLAGTDPRFTLLSLNGNHGKAHAMFAGAEHAGAPIVVFLDADLIRLQTVHIQALIEPVIRGKAEMSIGVFQRGRWMTDMAHRFLPVLSGQRCLRWACFADIDGLADFRSGIEAALNLRALLGGYRVQHVPWQGVTHVMKPEKVGLARGTRLYLKMNREIASTTSRMLWSELRARRRRYTHTPQNSSGS